MYSLLTRTAAAVSGITLGNTSEAEFHFGLGTDTGSGRDRCPHRIKQDWSIIIRRNAIEDWKELE